MVKVMKRHLATSIVLLSLLIPVSLAPNMVQAQPQPPQGDPVAIYREAGASPEQQQKIRDMAREFEQSAFVKAERIKNLMKKMQDLSLQPTPDEKVVMGTQDDINAAQADIANSRIKLMIRIRGLLTEEQRTKLVQILKERMANHPAPANP